MAENGLLKVDRIVNVRRNEQGYEFRLKWTGYSRRHNSWEPEENLQAAVHSPFSDAAKVAKPFRDTIARLLGNKNIFFPLLISSFFFFKVVGSINGKC